MKYNTNVVVISGNLTDDPDIRQTPSDVQTAHFTVAVNRGDKADFLTCVAFDKTAEAMRLYAGKGDPVLVRGSLRVNKWTDREGRSRTSYEIYAQGVELLRQRTRPELAAPAPSADPLADLEDLPFDANNIPF